jgi:hypothetical protein
MNFDMDFRSNSFCQFEQKVFEMREQDVLQSNIGFCTEMENEYAGIIIVCWEMRLLSRAGGQVMFGRLVTNRI